VTIALRCEIARGREFAAPLRQSARSLLRILEREEAELSIVLTGDEVIRLLNREYRSKDTPTDVLSFPQLEDGEEPGKVAAAMPPLLLGDIVISVATATRQAQAEGITPALRLRTLLIHGLLHLLGYDHERSIAEARRMFARERELAALLEAPAPHPRSRKVRDARRCA
jgi:rRNA maturation RNase YbeY